MKISINYKDIKGPYGGGISFYHSLKKHLLSKGHQVINHLEDKDIDIILIAAYSTWTTASYSYLDAAAYKVRYPNTVIVARINECDERKKTNHINKLLSNVAKQADFVIFIASWLKPLLEKQGFPKHKPFEIILNGTDKSIFNTEHKDFWNKKDKLRIVTHHWGGGYLKGHDIYQKLDKLLDGKKYNDKFEFTFIGNYPENLSYRNTKLINPLEGTGLANELKKHHVYITASRNEPAGMHHIEGAMCGLPILYLNSGALPEFCHGYGIEFNPENFEEKILEMYDNYDHWKKKIKLYDRTSEKMCSQYLKIFERLIADKNLKEKFNVKDLLKYLSIRLYSPFDKIILRAKTYYSNKSSKKNQRDWCHSKH